MAVRKAKRGGKKISELHEFWYGEIVRRRRVIIGLTACVFVGIGVVAFWPAEKEPEYNGKKLSEWVEICRRERFTHRKEALWAIQAIGTNALPYLLKRVRRDVPIWQRKTAEQCKRLGLEWPQQFITKRTSQQANAWEALGDLGSHAHSAIPEVYRLALESPSIGTARAAINFLSESAPDGIPALLQIIEKGKIDRRRWAIARLGQTRDVGTNEPAVVDGLLKCLQEEDQVVAESALLSLCERALKNGKVVSTLTVRLQDTHGMVRYCASRALAMLGNVHVLIPEFREAVPEFVNAQTDPYPLVREWATNALLRIAPEVLTNRGTHF